MRARATRMGGNAAPTPLAQVVAGLFAAGEQGVWFDPSDFSTMYQDSAGVTPVTAVEQPVGLILDKSKGLVRGAELVSNGDFASGVPTGWTSPGDATIAVVSGQMQVTSGSTSALATRTITGLTVGKWYEFRCTAVAGTGTPRFYVGITVGSPIFIPVQNGAYAAFRGFFLATQASAVINASAGPSPSAGVTSLFDNFSIKEVAGNHASQATTTSRPVLKQDGSGNYSLLFDGVDDSLATPSIDFTATDKVTVFAGVRKLSDAADGLIYGLGAPGASGTFEMRAPGSSMATKFQFTSRGTAAVTPFTSSTSFNAPVLAVTSGIGDISAPIAVLRVNGVQVDSRSGTQGTGNFASAVLNIGRASGSTLPFNGNLNQLIIVGRLTSPDELFRTERFVGQKTGVVL